jgi:hypothetical protein
MSLAYDDEIYLRNSLVDFGTPTGETDLRYQQDYFTGNGIQTTFNFSHQASTIFPVYIYLNGILQTSAQVTVSNVVVIFASPPPNLYSVVAVYQF